MNRKNAFTLTELIVVIAIMSILAGLLMPALGKARAKARQVKCISTIASLETALAMYATDYGLYPPSATDNSAGNQHNGNSHAAAFATSNYNNLIAALTSFEESGPYMSFKGKELIENSGGDEHNVYVLKDPWSQAYVYVCQKAVDGNNVDNNRGPFHPNATTDKDRNTYNIYSLGEDKVTNGGISYSDAGGSDWDLNTMFDNQDDGDWSSATDQSDGQYDDINSWDGARSG